MSDPRMALLFAIGPRRTGSTLLYQILCSDPDVQPHIGAAIPLAKLLDAVAWSRSSANYDRFTRFFFTSPPAFETFAEEICRLFLEHTRRAMPEARRLVIRGPELSLHAQALHDLLPEAQFVVSVRDPRDQVASELEVMERQVARGARDPSSLPGDPQARAAVAAAAYRDYISPILAVAARSPARVHFVRYEDLVTSTAPTLARLEAFTGLDLGRYRPDQEWQRLAVPLELMRAQPSWSEGYGKPMTDGRVGRYREALSAAQIATVEAATTGIMQRFSY